MLRQRIPAASLCSQLYQERLMRWSEAKAMAQMECLLALRVCRLQEELSLPMNILQGGELNSLLQAIN